ncbi:MAG: hypothetical protein AB8G77_19705 [Rhodothermales bacterium]
MKTLNAILRKNGLALVALLLVFAATGCDALNNEEPEVAALTEDDLEAASSILAESLSDQNEGLMANLNDMTADIGTSQLSHTSRRFWSNPGLRPCRGEDRAFEKTYDETTGVHSINYSRQNESEICSKDVVVSLNYTFSDSIGNFIATPRVDKDMISEIAFTGTRVGSGSYISRRGSRSLTFDQAGEWNLSGLQSNVASLRGSQKNDGSFEYTKPDSAGVDQTRSGVYNLEFNTEDVTITQSSSENSDLETQITGTIQYTMTMEKTTNGETEMQDVEGTIELEGNGRALLRFLGLRKIYRVSLDSGDVTDTDGETGGEG